MVFKIKIRRLGGRTHCILYAAKTPNMTYASCGTFVVRNEEYDDLQLAMSGVSFEPLFKGAEED